MQDLKPWHEEDSFWETVAPVLFSERRWSDAPLEVEDVVSLLGINPGAKVLDLCCGVGRHSLELARQGFAVTGVDRTIAYLERARQKAEEEGLDVEFVQADMRTFRRPQAFDAAVNLFTSFGYFEDPEDDRTVVMNVYESLRAGGVFLLDVMGKEVLARIFEERRWYEEEGITFLQETTVSKSWSWVESRWILLKDGEKREFKISHRLYSAVELSALVRESGFEAVDIYGDVRGAPYDHTAKRLVVAARKGGSE